MRTLKNRSVLPELLASGLLVTLLLGLTYLIGVAYYAGSLRGLGLPFEFMPLSRDGVLMQGAYAWMSIGAPTIVPLLAAAILVVLALWALESMQQWIVLGMSRLDARLAVSARRGPVQRNPLMQIGGEPGGEPVTAFAVNLRHVQTFSAHALRIILTGCGVFFAVLWMMVGATRAGEAQAQQVAGCSDCATSELTLNDDITMSGRVIRCNESHCIVQSAGKVLVLRRDDIKQLQTWALGTSPSRD